MAITDEESKEMADDTYKCYHDVIVKHNIKVNGGVLLGSMLFVLLEIIFDNAPARREAVRLIKLIIEDKLKREDEKVE